MKIVVASAVMIVSTFIGAAAFAEPIACTSSIATRPSEITGTWRVRQRDDADGEFGQWHDVLPQTFASDGSFSEQGGMVGRWCVRDNVLVWAYDDPAHNTVYRVVLGPQPMRGFMAWNGGNTGEVEIQR